MSNSVVQGAEMKDNRPPGDSFSEMVDGWVLQAIQDGVGGFGSLVCALPGVYPAVVRDAIRRLAQERRLLATTLQRMLREAALPWPDEQGDFMRPGLPAPHPLDFDWRYAPAGSERLLDEYAAL